MDEYEAPPEAWQDKTVPVNFDVSELLIALRRDCVAFLGFYLGDQLDLEIPEFHIDIWNQLLGFIDELNQPMVVYSIRKLFAVPRDHAKSTLCKLAIILFWKYSSLSFALYATKSSPMAKNAARDILLWLSSPQEIALNGQAPFIIKASETEQLWIMDIFIRRQMDQPAVRKRVILRALGADQQVRGLLILNMRPQIIIIDDIEDNDNTTKELQPKLDLWFFGAFIKSFAKKFIVVMIGNMIGDTTILARLSKDQNWNPTVYGSLVRIIETGEIVALWPGRHTVESLLADYRTYVRMGQGSTWEAEMMNITREQLDEKNRELVQIVGTPNPEDITDGMICLDPAFGKNNWNNDSALTVHAHIKGVDVPCIIDSRVGKFSEEEIFDQFLELSYYWGLTTWFIEAVAAQRIFFAYFKVLFEIRKMNGDLFTMMPLMGSKDSKGSRILASRSLTFGGSYGVAESQLDYLDKLEHYSPTSNDPDDLLDSAAYGPIAWEHSGTLIEQNGITKVILAAFQGSGTSAAKWGPRLLGF